MNPFAHFVSEDTVYFTLPCNGGLSGKNRTDDAYAEMSLALGVMPRMTGMQMRIILYIQSHWCKRMRQFPLNPSAVGFAGHAPKSPDL
jgi:hypothetical protein